MNHATVTPLEALKRLIEACKLVDFKDCPDLYNQFQTELAVAEMVVRDWVEPVAAQPALPKLPRTPEEVASFIGDHFEEFILAPVPENDRYSVSVHDLLSAFQAYEDAQPTVVAAPIAWLRNDGSEAKTAKSKAWMETRDYGNWNEVSKLYTIPLYAAPAIAAPVEVERDAARTKANNAD